MKRRHFLTICSTAVASAAASPARADTLAPIRVGTLASESAATIFYAQDQGFLAKRGLSAAIQINNSPSSIAAAVLARDLDVGYSDMVTLIDAHEKGLPFMVIAPGEVHSIQHPTLAVVARDPNVRLGKDFNGKTVASSTIRGFGYIVTNAWIDNNGGDSKTLKWIELPFPSIAAALQRGTIDAYCAPEPFCSAGVALGGHLLYMDEKPIAPAVMQGSFFVATDWLASNQTKASAFANALRDAGDWANQNPTGSAQILAKYSSVPLAVIESSKMRGQYPQRVDPAPIQPIIDGAARYGLISKSFPARELIAVL